MTTSIAQRAAEAVSSRLGRRRFVAGTAVVGSALVTAPEFLFRPRSAYAAVCGCNGSTCNCTDLCCDGYTEFCCTLWGLNSCPPGSVAGGWWKVDSSGYCDGGNRYYIDCHKPCGSCPCGGSGICSGACNGIPCSCANNSCANRKAGCTQFRYGNCNNHIACLGPIICRVVSCTPPWEIDSTCSASAVRTDNATRFHNRPCLQRSPIRPVVGDWDGDKISGIGFYDNRNARWGMRQISSPGGDQIAFYYGQLDGDLPVVGNWDGNGGDGVGVFRRSHGGRWYLTDFLDGGHAEYVIDFGREPGDIPVVGDWNGSGRDTIGVYRPSEGGRWYLTNKFDGGHADYVFNFGQLPGDYPVVGDWNGDGKDGIGVFRDGRWYLRNALSGGQASIVFDFGRLPGDIPVVGDWGGRGADGIGIYRPATGRWYLRYTASGGPPQKVVDYGPEWNIG